ncbi:nucleotidyltransferase family protein [Larkinella rosea]|uniref:Nucleotidyltransferase domain-containing protein n=1 Tax=Larkinella rosea TaxID=2025312 RepID=A0A3P1C4A3_9BACT|nr:nucleotidyltransferase domain-containing protein [Larkinella rosea]RRB07674.1 nucleotidyltransferase domain-containing protein [Larkinella rosea]
MLHPSIQAKLPQLITLLRNHKVKKAYAFGSVCTDRFTNESDIDLLIDFGITEPFDGYAENFWNLEEQLQRLLNRSVDLVPQHTLRNPYFISSVNKTRLALYE